jgi:hypothetical protein
MKTPHVFALFALLLVAVTPALANPTHTGTWTASVKNTQLQLNLRHKGEKGGQIGMPVPIAAFQGLSTAEGGTAPFKLEREAGTLHFEGRFSGGEGAGHFQFAPSAAYTQAMGALGYTQLTPDQQFQLALFDITPARVKELGALGYKDIPLKELIEVGIFQVTPEYIRELGAAGYSKLTLKQLVQTRIHDVTPERIRALAAAGFKNLELQTLMSMSIHGVTPEFIQEMRAAGFPSATPEDLVKLRIHGVDSAFVRSMSGGGKGQGDTRKKP